MTLTQELAQALRELHDDIADRFDMDSPSTNPGMKHAVAYASAALARYDAETSRGSEGEVIGEVIRIPPDENAKGPFPKYVRWLKVPYCGMKLYAAPQPAQPCAEAWRQAIREWWEMGDEFLQQEMGYIEWIEARAREISKGA